MGLRLLGAASRWQVPALIIATLQALPFDGEDFFLVLNLWHLLLHPFQHLVGGVDVGVNQLEELKSGPR